MDARASIRNDKGFTLVELMIAAVMAVIVVGGAYGMFITMKTANVKNKSDMEMQQNVRTAVGQVTRLLSMAGYQGAFNFSAYSSVARGIVYKDDGGTVVTDGNSICFTFYDEDKAFWGKLPTGFDKERRITIYQSGNQILAKMECFNDPTPLIHQFVQNPNRPVVLANNIGSLSFTYFDASSNAITPNTDNVTQITKVRVAVTGKTNFLDYVAGVFHMRSKAFSLSSDITPVNLGIQGHAVDTTPPAVPTGLTVTDPHVCVQLVASWNPSPEVDLAGYRVYWGNDSNYDHMQDVGRVTSFTLTGLMKGTNYHVTVCAYDTSGNVSAFAPDVYTGDGKGNDTTPNPVPPPAGPINLHATASPGDGQITLSWDTNPDDPAISSYWVYRKTITDQSNIGPFSPSYPISTLSTQPPTGITQVVTPANFSTKVTSSGSHYTMTDTGLTGCIMYEYAVVPINCDPSLVSQYTQAQYSMVYGNGVDIGYPSASLNAVTVPTDGQPPHPPTGLVGIPGAQEVFLSWTNPNDDDFKGVRIIRSTSHFPTSVTDGDLVVNDTTDGKGQSTTFNDKNLTNGTCYYYTAFAYDNCTNYSTGTCSVNANGQIDPACSRPCSGSPYGLPPAAPASSYTASYCSQKVNIGWSDPTNITQYPDIIGYNIYRSDNGSVPIKTDFKGVGSINVYSDTDYPSDGGTYAYSIRTVDCSGNLSDEKDIVSITAYPGQVYYDTGVSTTAMGKYSNWLQFNTANSSAWQAKLQGVTVTWSGNNTETNAYLSGISVYDGTNFVQVFGGSNGTPVSSGTPVTFNNFVLLHQATPSGNGLSSPYSTPIQFQWTNVDGTVTSADDMRLANVSIQYNYVLYYFDSYDNNLHESNPQLAGCLVQTYAVARPYCPTFLDVTQSQPLPATFAQTQTGLILIPPDKLTDVSTYLVDTTPNLVGMNYVKLFYAFTNRTSTTPPMISTNNDSLEAINRWSLSNPRGFIPMTTIPVNPGNDLLEYKTTFKNHSTINGHPIPAIDNYRIWYFMLAKDNNGNVTRWPTPAPVDPSFNYDQLAGAGVGSPSVTVGVVNPPPGKTVSGTVKIQVAAYSTNPGLTAPVALNIDGAFFDYMTLNMSTGNWEYSWDTTVSAHGYNGVNGTHTISATAIAGTISATSTTVSCTVDNNAVRVSITYPPTGYVCGGTQSIQASANSTQGTIKSAAILITDSSGNPVYSQTTNGAGLFLWNWDTTTLPNNTAYTISVTATNSNNQTGATSISVTVNNGAVAVSITSPSNGRTYGGNATIQASASTTQGTIQSATILITDSSGNPVYSQTANGAGPFSWSWDTTTVPNASYTIAVTATNTNQVTGTESISVTIDNTAVSCAIITPVPGAKIYGTYTINITASTNPSRAIDHVYVMLDKSGTWTEITANYNSSTGYWYYNWDVSGFADNTTRYIDAKATSLTKTAAASEVSCTKLNPPTISMNKLTYSSTSGGTYTTMSPTPVAGTASLVPKADYIEWYVNVTAGAGVKSVTLSESTDQSNWVGVPMYLSSAGVYYNSTPRQLENGKGKNVYYKFTVTDNNNTSVTIPGTAGMYYWIQTQ